MTVEDFAAFPRGTFALVLDLGKAGLAEGSGRIDLATDVNATSKLKSTAPISTTAPAAVADETASSRGGSVQAAIQAAWPEVGPVAVSRFRAEEPTRRGYTYHVTFHGYAGDLPPVRVDMANATGFLPEGHADEVLKGSPSRLHGYRASLDGDPSTPAYAGALYPCYVMLFDERLGEGDAVPADLEAARERAAFVASLCRSFCL